TVRLRDRESRIPAGKPRCPADSLRKTAKTASAAGPGLPRLPEKLALLGRLLAQRAQQAGFRGRRTVRVAGAQLPELCGVARKGGVVQRQCEPDASALLDRLADPVDRGDQPRVIGLAADTERPRQIRWPD